MSAATAKRPAFKDYFEKKALIMLALGFSSGLPFLLVNNTFGYWLRDEGTSLTAIGFVSWIGLAYALKFLWAPIIDHTTAPGLRMLGRRRSWMLMAQVFVALGLAGMGAVGLRHGLIELGAVALLVAFASATQDIVIDAWRIESADDADELGLLTSAYTIGYRMAMLASEALILIVATQVGWNGAYLAYGALMVVGALACLAAAEPARADAAMDAIEARSPLWSARGLSNAVAGPFVAFFRAHGPAAILMLLAITLFQLPNFVMGPMVNPLYHDIGLSKDVVGAVRASFGLVGTLAGVAAGGYLSLRLGYMRALLLGGAMQIVGTAAYAVLPLAHDPITFAAIMALDNFGIAAAGLALVTYMSSLTSLGYTASQYALLTSAFAWTGKILKGFTGSAVDGLSAGHGLMDAYSLFFLGAGVIGIPSLLLFYVLDSRQRRTAAGAVSAG